MNGLCRTPSDQAAHCVVKRGYTVPPSDSYSSTLVEAENWAAGALCKYRPQNHSFRAARQSMRTFRKVGSVMSRRSVGSSRRYGVSRCNFPLRLLNAYATQQRYKVWPPRLNQGMGPDKARPWTLYVADEFQLLSCCRQRTMPALPDACSSPAIYSFEGAPKPFELLCDYFQGMSEAREYQKYTSGTARE